MDAAADNLPFEDQSFDAAMAFATVHHWAPFSGVDETLAGIRNVNALVAGTRLPRIADSVIEQIIHANPFEYWWHQPPRFD